MTGVRAVSALAMGLVVLGRPICAKGDDGSGGDFDHAIVDHVRQLVDEGRQIFRYDTFDDEDFWGGQLHLHEAIAGAEHGGVGPGLGPAAALGVGLKVDVDVLPRGLRKQLKRGQVDLNDPATTLALLRLDAVVGLTGRFDPGGHITSVGIQCALCHSTVDDSFAPGIGHRAGTITMAVRDAGGRDPSLRWHLRTRSRRCRGDRPHRVPEVAAERLSRRRRPRLDLRTADRCRALRCRRR